eukprot:scaffold23183_cov72-Phaeocystis_antarctica.AAC.1
MGTISRSSPRRRRATHIFHARKQRCHSGLACSVQPSAWHTLGSTRHRTWRIMVDRGGSWWSTVDHGGSMVEHSGLWRPRTSMTSPAVRCHVC